MYQVEIASRRVEKELDSLDPVIQKRVIRNIKALSENPRPQGVRKLSGEMQGVWRLRVGEFRILYDIDDNKDLVIIMAVLYRRDAYR